MYEMLPLLGQLPYNAFSGLVDNDNNDNSGEVDDVDKESVTAVSSSQQKPIPPSYVGGNSNGMYNLRHDID